jgi:hypothetical protein
VLISYVIDYFKYQFNISDYVIQFIFVETVSLITYRENHFIIIIYNKELGQLSWYSN